METNIAMVYVCCTVRSDCIVFLVYTFEYILSGINAYEAYLDIGCLRTRMAACDPDFVFGFPGFAR